MLILTRRPVETICIGDDVTITVLGVVGNSVRLGIDAPRHIVVDRAEIRERKRREALRAAGAEIDGNRADGPVIVPRERPVPEVPRTPEPIIDSKPEPVPPDKPEPVKEPRRKLKLAGVR